MNHRNFAVALFFFGLAGCTGLPATDAQSQPIINGTDDTGDPAVVVVAAQMPNSQQASLCTGSIISPHVILTAAHCVSPATVGAGAKFIVFTGTVLTMTAPSSEFLPVLEVHYDTAFDAKAAQNGHDVGVVILKSPASIAPLPYNRTAIAAATVGQAARLIGYGITSADDKTGTTAGTRRQAPTKLNTVDNLLLSFLDNQHNICEGDSGGPALMTIDGQERVVGLTSFGYTGCPVDTGGGHTRVDSYLTFIDQYVKQFDPPSKGAGDACTSDIDCLPLTCSAHKVCVQTCDPTTPAPSGCPSGTMCMNVDGQNICNKPMDSGGAGSGGSGGGGKSGGCSFAAGLPCSGGGCGLGLFALAAILGGLALRRRPPF